ncbi:MAG: phospholipase [Muribaculaceae bacterium]|nr:phospholipase [Muribaculaceae bacterium]
MTGALIILAATILAGIVLKLTHREAADDGATDEAESTSDAPQECCGLHAVCEKKAAAESGHDYYDDEELDRFAGRDAAAYSDEEIEEFRQVLYTLIPAEVYSWGGALTRRGVALPEPLRDEWIMLCQDK